jgi:NTP pyrophosphatase (non-canonical NTP hydrolase)
MEINMNDRIKKIERATQTAETHFNGLSPADAEALTLISEECAEVIQAISKIQRHGLWSEHPESHIPNWRTLQREVGDLLAALRVGEVQRLLDWGNVIGHRERKLMNLPMYLHHAKVIKDE